MGKLEDFGIPSSYPGRNLGAIAQESQIDRGPNAGGLHVGEWYYPPGAGRWSVFRGLMTSSMVKAVLQMYIQVPAHLSGFLLRLPCGLTLFHHLIP